MYQNICKTYVSLKFKLFAVYDEDMFGDPNFIGQACYPLKCLREGYRSIPLQNGFGEDLELSSLLVRYSVKPAVSPF